jgi:hypothetical protein
MYADDSGFMLSPQAWSLQCLIKDLDNFSVLSGLKPNYDKCTQLRIGSLKKTTFTLPCSLPIKWADGEVDILGYSYHKYINKLSTLNFNRKLVKINKILQPWRGTYLSIYGKIPQINSLVISQFTHLRCCLLLMIRFSNHMSKKYFALSGTLNQKIKRAYLYNEYVSRLPPKSAPLLVHAAFGGRRLRLSSHRCSIFHWSIFFVLFPANFTNHTHVFIPLFPLMSLCEIVCVRC